jgi:MFS family permease
MTPDPHSKAAPSAYSNGRQWSTGTLSYSLMGLIALFGWLLLGDFAWQLRDRAVTPLAQLLLKTFNTSDIIAGFLIGSVPYALGMFVSPIFGYWSDRHRSRWGRRLPFLMVSTPVAAGAMIAMGFIPEAAGVLDRWLGGRSPGTSVCFLVLFAACWGVFEISAVVGYNMFTALINDVVPRELIGRFFGLFRIVGLSVGAGFNYFLMGYSEQHFSLMFIVLGSIYGVVFGLMCLRIKEGEYPEVAVTLERPRWVDTVRTYFRECFRHRFYLWAFAAWALGNVAFAPVNTFCLFHARSVGLSMEVYGKFLAYSLVVSLLLSYPLGILADRFHPLRVAIGAMSFYFVVCVWASFSTVRAESFAVAFILHVIGSGMFVTGAASYAQRLYPRAKFAQFASAAAVLAGVVFLLTPPLVGAILDLTHQAYRHTFTVGAVFALLALVSLVVVYRGYLRLGGDTSFKAPE